MPAPSPFPLAGHPGQQSQIPQPFYPSLHLFPLNDSFIPKQISLAPQHGRVKIGRQTNAKTVPGERNGYFDSKVLSRQHAEVWEEGGKIFIKDVKSSNGTFINGERLSPEGVESEPFELKSEDTVEFGIDIVGEDNKTIIHHKVAAKIYCVLTPDDLHALQMHPPVPPSHHNAFNNRRPGMQSQIQNNALSNNALGGMGAPRGGKSGLTFDHILSRLQNELHKSRETGAELNGLSGVINEVNDVLGGNLPNNLPPYPAVLPPVRPPVEHPPPPAEPAGSVNSAALTSLQNQLHETQSTIAAQKDKIRHLENYMAEQESFRREIGSMKEQMEERRREVEMILAQRRAEEDPGSRFTRGRKEAAIRRVEEDDDDDDARSVATLVPDDRDVDEGDEERHRRREELGRPRTPEPTGHGYDEEYEDDHHRSLNSTASSSTLVVPSVSSHSTNGSSSSDSHSAALAEIYNQNSILTSRIEALSGQLDSALELSKKLESQTTLAHQTIAQLNTKLASLEHFVQEQQALQEAAALEKEAAEKALKEAEQAKAASESAEKETPPEPSVSQTKWDEWRERVEGNWKSERESWAAERARLADAVKEWERRTADLERKEQERQEKEEVEQRRREALGFYDSDDEGDVFSKPNGIPNGNGHPLMNGHRRGKGGRRRRLSTDSQDPPLANGSLPSPLASPSSTSYYHSSSPSHDHHLHGVNGINGKLPLSPPNTSPRSRAESLRPTASEGDEVVQTEDPNPKGALGLANGVIAEASPVSLTAAPSRGRMQFASDIVSQYSILSIAAFAFAAALMIWSVADVISLMSPLAIDSPTSFVTDLLAPYLNLTTISDELGFVADSLNSIISSTSTSHHAVPSALLFFHDSPTWKHFQPMPVVSAAGVVVLGIAAWAVANRVKD